MSTKTENNKTSSLNLLKRIYKYLGEKRKRDVKFVLFLSILSSLAESVSIALLIPFVNIFINPESYTFNTLFVAFFEYFNITNKEEIIYLVSAIFILIVLISGLIRITYIKQSNNLTDNITSDFRVKIFSFLLSKDYTYYLKKGSNEILSNLAQKSGAFTTIVFASINIFNSVLISLAIISVLVFNEPYYTPIIVAIVSLFFFIYFKIRTPGVLRRGQAINLNQNFMIDIFQNTVGYLPEILVYNIKKFFLKTLSNLSKETAQFSAQARTIAMHPKVYLETFIIIVAIIAVSWIGSRGQSQLINASYLAILAFAAQKCLPLINSLYALSINFKKVTPVVDSFLSIMNDEKIIKIEDEIYDPLDFEKVVKLENISFKYNKDLQNIINNFNFEISKGDKVAVKGKTGSGKSTLINIVSGLLNPSKGKISVDGITISSENLKNWQKNIAIVPQNIFLNDASILENIGIAQNFSAINLNKAKESAKLAQIDSFIESLPNKYNETVGERGIRLSGGQRQRLGIARALYRDAKVIILDEPTNALDANTEKELMDAITNLNKEITIIMISHSNTSLEYFDKIIDLNIKK